MPIEGCPDFATKAELQELKQQINNLLGKADGEGGTIDVIEAGTLEGTAVGSTLALVGTAIVGIVARNTTSGSFASALAKGGIIFEGIKANGTKATIEGLTNVGKTVGKNVGKVGLLAVGIKVSATTVALVLALVGQILNTGLTIGTLNLIKQNTKNNEISFNSLARNYSSMMGFVSQNKSDIEKTDFDRADPIS